MASMTNRHDWDLCRRPETLFRILPKDRRKMRLLACALHCLCVADQRDKGKRILRTAYSLADAKTDGQIMQRQRRLSELGGVSPSRLSELGGVSLIGRWYLTLPNNQEAAAHLLRSATGGMGEHLACCTIIRDIFPNPYWTPHRTYFSYLARPKIVVSSSSWPFCGDWVTPDALQIAQLAYKEHDFSGLPIIADALEENGCVAKDLLVHLRDPGPHHRGCWALDLILGVT